MESNFKGYFDKIDEFNRIVISHNETKLNYISWFKWTTKLIGKPSPDFIGIRNKKIALPEDFIQGDEVEVHFKIVKCPKSEESGHRIIISYIKTI